MASRVGDPSDLRQRLLAASGSLGLRLNRRVADQLIEYVALLHRWNQVHSLSAWKTPVDLLVNHVHDSMTLISPLRRFAAGCGLRILDAGSGPGFPAAVLAIIESGWSVTAVDAVAKKAAFVRQAAAELAIGNLSALHARLEELRTVDGYDVVVTRAFGSLEKLVACTRQLLAPNGIWVAQKGKPPEQEIDELGQGVEVFHVEPVTVPGLAAERCLVWMRPRSV